MKPKHSLKNKILCVVAGASGGHITPALVLAKKWLERNHDGSILFFSTGACPYPSIQFASNQDASQITRDERDITSRSSRVIFKMPQGMRKLYQGITKIPCNLSQRPGKKLWRYPIFFSQLIITFFKSFYHLKKQRPKKIISTGGLLALPVAIAGWLLRIPIELYELNVIPGKAVQMLAPVASKIFITFEQSKKHFRNHAKKCEFVDYPLRFTQADKIFNREKIIENINKNKTIKFSPTGKTIFFMGGSQGSILINNLAKEFARDKERSINIQVIHQTGSRDKTDWHTFYTKLNIPAHVFAYEDRIQDFYCLSDLVVCRAGAGTLFELAFFEKQAIVIPLRTKTTDHQVANAHEMAKRYPDLFIKNHASISSLIS